MTRFYSLLALVVGTGLMIGCKKDKADEPTGTSGTSNTVRVTVQPMFGNETVYLDSVYTTAEGYDIKFTNLKFFAEDIQGITGNSEVAMFDYSDGTLLFEKNADPASITSFTSNLGVGATNNHADPTAFPIASPLNITNAADMHWSWNPGYIFMKVEAKVDTIQDGNELFDHNLIYHVGKDVNLQTLSFSNITWQPISGNVHVFPLKMDMQTFFTNGSQVIDVKTEYTSHSASGQEALSLKAIENLKAAITPL